MLHWYPKFLTRGHGRPAEREPNPIDQMYIRNAVAPCEDLCTHHILESSQSKDWHDEATSSTWTRSVASDFATLTFLTCFHDLQPLSRLVGSSLALPGPWTRPVRISSNAFRRHLLEHFHDKFKVDNSCSDTTRVYKIHVIFETTASFIDRSKYLTKHPQDFGSLVRWLRRVLGVLFILTYGRSIIFFYLNVR